MRSIIVCFTVFLSFSTNIFASNIKIENSVKEIYKDIIYKDLKVLSHYEFKKRVDRRTLDLFGVRNLAPRNMTKWLEDRIQVVIAQKAYKDLDVKVVNANYTFPYNTSADMPIIENDKILSNMSDVAAKKASKPNPKEAKKATTVMSNIGSALYANGKFKNQLFQINIMAQGLKYSHRVTSPRTGIIMIGDGLFMDRFDIVKNDKTALANSLSRLSTFFHEARHSDGHGKSIGFFHAKCPEGHDYEHLNACDRNLNGPYTIGAVITKEFIKNCKKCSYKAKAALKMRYLDSLNRIIKTTLVSENEKLLKKLLSYKNMLVSIIKNKIFKGEKLKKAKEDLKMVDEMLLNLDKKEDVTTQIHSVDWNASPEGRR